MPRELAHAMQDALEKYFHRAFQRYVTSLRNSPTLARAAAQARDDDVDALMKHFEPSIDRLAEERRRMYAHAAVLTKREISRKLRKAEDDLGDVALLSSVGLSFDPELAAAASLMDDASLDFIVEFTESQREAVRRALVNALRQGKGTQAVARAFRNTIGLTSYQQDVVDNYRALLERNSVAALDRILRDRRYDVGLASALANNEPLSSARIDAMVDRYASRYLAMRAETIARTETTRVLNQARQGTVEQLVDAAGFDNNDVVRTWSSVQDKRTRDTHAAMDGQERGLGDAFTSPSGALLMYPGDPEAPAEETINCRCAVLISFKRAPSAAVMNEVTSDEAG